MLKTLLATKTVKNQAKDEKCMATTEWYSSTNGKQKQEFP
jgi:hypothetical protein